jgi:hypothetical protein
VYSFVVHYNCVADVARFRQFRSGFDRDTRGIGLGSRRPALARGVLRWQYQARERYEFSILGYVVHDDGRVSTSATHTITVTTTTSTTPSKVVFQASADHATLVTSYRLDVFANGAKPGSSAPVASSNLGKPTPDANKIITVDRTTFFSALAHATYLATVSAVGSGGESRSPAISFTR